MPVILAPRRQRQEDQPKFMASLVYTELQANQRNIIGPCLKEIKSGVMMVLLGVHGQKSLSLRLAWATLWDFVSENKTLKKN